MSDNQLVKLAELIIKHFENNEDFKKIFYTIINLFYIIIALLFLIASSVTLGFIIELFGCMGDK